jgi:hypothetical protein
LGVVCVLCITVLALYSKSINADLIEVDLLTSNDAFITRDAGTGLDWLDVTLTLDHSVNEVLGGFGGYIDMGFRYATTDEVMTLYTHAPIINFDVDIPDNWPGAENLIRLMGATSGSPNDTEWSQGYAGLNEPSTGSAYAPVIFSRLLASQGAGADILVVPTAFDVADGNIGSYLVRSTAVPIPPALYLFGSGLLGLVGLARRKAS